MRRASVRSALQLLRLSRRSWTVGAAHERDNSCASLRISHGAPERHFHRVLHGADRGLGRNRELARLLVHRHGGDGARGRGDDRAGADEFGDRPPARPLRHGRADRRSLARHRRHRPPGLRARPPARRDGRRGRRRDGPHALGDRAARLRDRRAGRAGEGARRRGRGPRADAGERDRQRDAATPGGSACARAEPVRAAGCGRAQRGRTRRACRPPARSAAWR